MREVNLGNLSFSPEEQELLQRMERGAGPRQVSRPHWWRTIAIIYMFVLVIGLVSTWLQNQPATQTQWANAAAGTAQTRPPVQQQTDPAAAYAPYNRGVWHRQRNEYEQALTEFDEAIRLKSNFAEAYEERGYAYLMLGRHESAIRDFNTVLRLKPNDAQTYAFRGVAYAWSGDYQMAVENLNAAIRLNPTDGLLYLQRGTTYVNLGQYQLGIKNYDRAIELDPS